MMRFPYAWHNLESAKPGLSVVLHESWRGIHQTQDASPCEVADCIRGSHGDLNDVAFQRMIDARITLHELRPDHLPRFADVAFCQPTQDITVEYGKGEVFRATDIREDHIPIPWFVTVWMHCRPRFPAHLQRPMIDVAEADARRTPGCGNGTFGHLLVHRRPYGPVLPVELASLEQGRSRDSRLFRSCGEATDINKEWCFVTG